MFSLESPHRGNSNSTHNRPFSIQIKMKITLNYPKSAAKDFCKRLKKEYEIAVVNEPSVFQPLKFYCTYASDTVVHCHSNFHQTCNTVLPHQSMYNRHYKNTLPYHLLVFHCWYPLDRWKDLSDSNTALQK